MFAADVLFNLTNFPNLTTGTGTGTTYGQILVPSSPDAVWPNSGILTLRVTTPAGGSITEPGHLGVHRAAAAQRHVPGNADAIRMVAAAGDRFLEYGRLGELRGR